MPERAFLAPIFTWRSAILQSDLRPTTRHVLLTLACYMNEAGESAFPAIPRLMQDTGLGRTAVEDHLRQAHQRGWVVRTPRKRDNGGQSSNLYLPALPTDFVRRDSPPPTRGDPPRPRGGTPPRPRGGHELVSKNLPEELEPGVPNGTLVGEDADTDVETVDNPDNHDLPSPIRDLHEHFNRSRQGKPLALTRGRAAVYRARLRKFTPTEIMQAIERGCGDPFWQGRNDRGTRYDYPENLLRNDERVSQLLDRDPPAATSGARTDPRVAWMIYGNVLSGRYPESMLERDPILVRLRARGCDPRQVTADPATETAYDAFRRAYEAERAVGGVEAGG